MKNKIILGVFVFFTALAVTVLLLPADLESVYSENRTPATMMPMTAQNVASGEWSANFEDYLGDNLGFRSELTAASEWIEGHRGIENKEFGKIISTSKDIGTSIVQKSSLLVLDNTIMEVFIQNREAEQKYIDTINYFAQKLPDMKIYSMLIPTQLEFQEEMYANIGDSQRETIEYIYSSLDDRVVTVDAYSALGEHRDEYIYFRTDHHWTALGAYYGYRAFLEASGDSEFVEADDFTKNKVEKFTGYLFKQAQSPELARYPDVIEWYDTNYDGMISVENRSIKNGVTDIYDGMLFDTDKENYGLFMSGDQPLSVITNYRKDSGKTIVIMKDSYSNTFIPWLINNYKRIILVDPRTSEENLDDIIAEFNPDELMVMNYIFTTTIEDYCDMLKDMPK